MLLQTDFVLLQTGFEIKINIGVSVGYHRLMILGFLTQRKKINYNQHNGVFLWLHRYDRVRRHQILQMLEFCGYLNSVAFCPKSVGISLVPSYFIIEAT